MNRPGSGIISAIHVIYKVCVCRRVTEIRELVIVHVCFLGSCISLLLLHGVSSFSVDSANL